MVKKITILIISIAIVISIMGCASVESVDTQSQGSFFGTNLIKNGDAEEGLTVLFDEIEKRETPHRWIDVEGEMCISEYGKGAGGELAEAEIRGEGENYFWGGKVSNSSIEQIVDVSEGSVWIDEHVVTFELSGVFGGYRKQNDRAFLLAEFLDKNGVVLDSVQLGPVTNADRNNVTTMVFRETTGNVPEGTQSISFQLNAIRVEGTANDGYADDLSMVLRK